VRLRYRLAGESRDAVRNQFLTVRPDADSWSVVADTHGPTDRDLWDLTDVSVVRGRRSLVLGSPAQRSRLRGIAAQTDAAARTVDDVWGRSWPRTTVVVVPAGVAGMGALLGRRDTEALSGLAAVTTGQQVGPGRAGADRIVLNPVAYESLTPQGRRVVLTHEVTHVATRASAGDLPPPPWLVEGFADWVAYRGSGLPREVIARQTLERARRGDGPNRLPEPKAFDPGAASMDVAYEQAWWAVDLLAREHGARRVVAFYRAASARPADPAPGRDVPAWADADALEALRLAFRDVLATSESDFTDRWRADVARAAG
jgi:hypothetical protein